MRRQTIRWAAGFLGSLFSFHIIIGSAHAITNGIPDENRHPYVGAIFFTLDGEDYRVCTGSLLSPTVMLTAGHCTEGAIDVRVTFDTQVAIGTLSFEEFVASNPLLISGTAFTHPDFCTACAGGLVGYSQYDVGIIVLDEPADVGAFAALPETGLVDTLAMGTRVDIVGYGVNQRLVGGGPPVWKTSLTRIAAVSQYIASENRGSEMNIRLTTNPAQGKGGACMGDSGGPALLGGSSVILAVTSFGTNPNCAGMGYFQRIDLPEVLAFIEGFL